MGYVVGCAAHTFGLHVPFHIQSRIRSSDTAHCSHLGGAESVKNVHNRQALSSGFEADYGSFSQHHISCRHSFGGSDLSSRVRRQIASPCLRVLKRWSCEVRAKRSTDNDPAPQYSSQAKIRSEVISPFRTVRMFFSLAFISSGSLGFLLTLPRLIGSIGHAANASPVPDVLKDIGIDLAAVAIFGLLYRSDVRARDVQLAKLSREETLGVLRVELANKKVVTLEQLRGLCRIVIVSGTTSYVEEALQQGEQLREELLERGVLVVPYPTDGPLLSAEPASSQVQQDSGSVAVKEQTTVTTTNRWLANPIYTTEWARWLNEQKKIANVSEDKSVYISLRLDGRVRGSGVGLPPWKAFVAQLPPMTGMWKGPLDGMDGRI